MAQAEDKNLPSLDDYIIEDEFPSVEEAVDTDLPSLEDNKESVLPSIEEEVEAELPSVDDYVEKEEEELVEEVVVEEDLTLDEVKELIEEVKAEILDIPQIKHFDEVLEKLCEAVDQVKSEIPEVPEPKVYDDEIEAICDAIDSVKENISSLPEVKYYDEQVQNIEDRIDSVIQEVANLPEPKYYDTDLDSIKEDITKVREELAPLPWVENTFSGIEENFEKVSDVIDTLKEKLNFNFDEYSDSIDIKFFESKVETQGIKEEFESEKEKIWDELKKSSVKIFEYQKTFKDDDRKLKKQILGEYNTLKNNIKKELEEATDKSVKTDELLLGYFTELKGEISNLPEVKYYDQEINELQKLVSKFNKRFSPVEGDIKSLYRIVEDIKKTQIELNEQILDEPANVSQDVGGGKDPLTPTDQKFATLDDLSKHYTLFVNRIQQQLSTVGGGGAGFIKDLADVDISGLSDGYILQYNASENKWETVANSAVGVSTSAASLVLDARNNNIGYGLTIGTPVYQTGYNSGQDRINIEEARASQSSTMPAKGVVRTDLANNTNGTIIVYGELEGVDTSAFDVADELYVAPGGGLTNVRPTDPTHLVQKIAVVLKKSAANGAILVYGAGRTNDVPNNISIAGSVTAASFHGDGSGLTNVGFDTNFIVGTAITMVDGVFSGNLSVGGTLTYQDVKHVDSVGIITAQQGIQVLANGVDVTGVSTFNSDVEVYRTSGSGRNITFYDTDSTKQGSILQASSRLEVEGTNELALSSNADVHVVDRSWRTERAIFRDNGAVELYYPGPVVTPGVPGTGVKRFETTGVGATIFGTTETQQLNVSGVSTFSGAVTLESTNYLQLKDSTNIIGHNGVNNLFRFTDTLQFRGDTLFFQEYDGTEYMRLSEQFGVQIKHQGSTKLQIESDGITVTGTINDHTIPSGSGTFALTSDVPTNNNELTNGAGYITTSFTNTNQLTNGAGFVTFTNNNQLINGAGFVTFTNNNQLINGAGYITTSFTNTNQLTNGAGFITASDDITGTSAGLSGSPNITVSAVTATSGEFSGNVTIGGTLTYQDVTNVDSLGIITARSDVIVGGGLSVTGISTFNGDVNFAGDINGNVTIVSTDTGSSAAPELTLYRNSASPAPGDYLGQLMFKGENSNGGQENYAKITGKITDETLGTEDGLIETAIKGNGSFTIVSRQRSDELQLLNGVGISVDGDSTFTGDITANGNIVGDDSTNISGINSVTATSFHGDGSGLTGVASTDFIVTGTAATFNNVVNVGTGITLDATSGIITATNFFGYTQGQVSYITATETLTNKTLRNPTFESGANSPEFLETRYVNATQQDFVQLYTGGSSGSYFTQGEYQKIATITPSGDHQNYTFNIRLTATSASNYQIVNFTGGLRANTLPDLDFTVNFSEEHNGVRFIEPKLWTKETTTAGFILAFEYVHSSSLFGGVNVEATIIPRSSAQRANVAFNTTQDSEQSSIDTGFTERDPTLTLSTVNGVPIFGTEFKIEGSTDDGFETTITTVDATADRTITFPDSSGTVALLGDGVMSNVVDDTSPQLGGNLDLNSKDITGTGNVNITGIATVVGTSGTTTIGGVGNTALYVDGNARVVGVLTVGRASVTIDGDNNQVSVGIVTITNTSVVIGDNVTINTSASGINSAPNVLYVAKDGNDDNNGTSIDNAFLTIKAAVGAAQSGTTVKVLSGNYVEDNPIELPAFSAVVGDDLRTCKILPNNATSDIFHVNKGCKLQNMTFSGHLSPAAAVAFPDSGATNVGGGKWKGPYVQNCTSDTTTGTGIRIDGSKAVKTKSMNVDAFTQYNQGGVGVAVTNEGYAQLVSVFTICCDKAITCHAGGQADVANSNCSFGTLGLVADGKGDLQYIGTCTAAADAAQDNVTINVGAATTRPYDGQIVFFGELFESVETITVGSGGTGYTSTPTVTVDAPTGVSGETATAFATLEGESVASITIISSGSQYQTTPSVTISAPDVGVNTATATANMAPIYYTINSSTPIVSGITTLTLEENLINAVGVGTSVHFFQQSKIVASSHTFEYIGAGNTITEATPKRGGVTIQANEVTKTNGGNVVYTSTDQSGNFRIGDDLQINQNTGTISGRAFSKSLFSEMTPFILALS